MAKQSGLGETITIDDSGGMPRDISNDVRDWQASTPRGVQDITGVDKSAMERQLLLADYSLTLNGKFNPGSNLSHDVFKTVTSSAATRTSVLLLPTSTLTAEVIFTDYQLTRSDAAELDWSAPASLANGTAPAWS